MRSNFNDIETLVVTMGLTDPTELLDRMNIQSDFVIGNQSDRNENERVRYNGHEGVVLTREERGVGLNRNTVLSNADKSICVLADDDMVFRDGYVDTVVSWFDRIRKADILIFNLGDDTEPNYQGERKNKRVKRINPLNYMNYGAARIVFRRKAVSYQGIFFNTNFGGGTRHMCGEDTLFLKDCIRHGLRIYAVPDHIASIKSARESTWFHGYTREYFFDKGVFLSLASPRMASLLGLYFVMRHGEYSSSGLSRHEILKAIRSGIRYIRKREYNLS